MVRWSMVGVIGQVYLCVAFTREPPWPGMQPGDLSLETGVSLTAALSHLVQDGRSDGGRQPPVPREHWLCLLLLPCGGLLGVLGSRQGKTAQTRPLVDFVGRRGSSEAPREKVQASNLEC